MAGPRWLLRDVLQQVSRSFFLTLQILPSDVRDQIGLAYLFARAADTIADTDLIAPEARLTHLARFQAQFQDDQIHWGDITAIQSALSPHQTDSAERVLVENLDRCFQILEDFSPDDRVRLRTLLATLTRGMEMDLTVFQEATGTSPIALPRMDDLDRYIYYVAGCVGEFWTSMIQAHRTRLKQWASETLLVRAVRFGKGLQLTNIMKDLARDLRRGRCYVPQELLHQVDLHPKDLLSPEAVHALQPIVRQLTTTALAHLEQGWAYTMALPRGEVRIRLACMWPILIGVRTLQVVRHDPGLLDPVRSIKISRGEVYRMMAITTLTGADTYINTAYFGRLRKHILC